MATRRHRFLIAGLVAVIAAIASAEQRPGDDERVVREFRNRIGEYAALHEKLEANLPPLNPDGSIRSYLLNRVYLAKSIKTARPKARQGDIFTPAVSALFKRILARAVSEDALDQLYDYDEAHPFLSPYHPRVYDPYPDWASHTTPVAVLQQLPPLPEDIQYRLLDHDLVLWDIHADLIVDVLPDAIARTRPRAAPEGT